MKKLKIIKSLLFLCIAVSMTSCVKKDEYKKYVLNGEIVYPGKADSVIARSGHNRVQLDVAMANDPLVTKLKVYWKNFQDSAEVAVGKITGKDTVKILVPNLTEGNYNFTLYSYDAKGNKSVGTTVAGQVYGNTYLTSLNTRLLKSVAQSADGSKVILNWGSPSAGETGAEISYTDADGTAKKIIMPADTASITISSFKDGSTFTYRSVFKPDSLSIDSYFSEAGTGTLPRFERQLDKSLFKAMILPTDVLDGGFDWLMEFLWDDNFNPPGFATEAVIPCWFTFDMGQSVSLSRLKYWQPADRIYSQQSVKKFEVWGSNSPDADGGWTNWTRLTTCESVKPSGLPDGQINGDDAAYANSGEPFQFPEGLPKFRFIRIKVLEVWGDGPFAAMEEFNFYTHDH
jgi:hypothetical protein